MNYYWLFNGLAWVAACALWLHRGRRFGIAWGALVDAVVLSLPFALVGAHLWTLLELGSMRSGWRQSMLTVSGWTWGYGSMGAVLGVALTLLLVARLHRLSLGLVLDAAGPTVFIASILGRVACIAQGCCFGGPSDLPWAAWVMFDGRAGEPAITRHPVQLYEILLSATFLALLPIVQRRCRLVIGSGAVFLMCIAFYAGSRMALEAFRAGHSSPVLAAGMTYTQWVCGPTVLICLLLLGFGRRFTRSRVDRAPGPRT